MEFWGVEVKSGQSLVVEPADWILHLSQACLEDVKKAKGSDPISLFVKTGDQKLVLGFLSTEKFPHLSFDIVFDKKFELSHNWKNGSVHFTGYKSVVQTGGDDFDFEEEDPLTLVENGKPKVSTKEAKKSVKSEQKKASRDNEEFGADQIKSEEDSSEDGFESDDDDNDSEYETDDSEEEDEEPPVKADVSKKRPAESTKPSAVDKKAKFITPEKTGAKKDSVHIATPYPAKQAGKKPATSELPKQQRSSAFPCQSCNRAFNSDGALQDHMKAKHGTAK